MAYLSNTSVNGDLGVSGLTSVGSAGLKFTSGIINIFGSSNSGGTGDYSISIGSQAAATGSYSVALGCNAKASGGIAIGGSFTYPTTSIGYGSIAIGPYDTQANGDYDIAVGPVAKAGGNTNEPYGIAIGYGATASGSKGIAIGYGAMASSGIVVSYKQTKATAGSQFGGVYNSAYTGSNYLVIGSPTTNYCYKTSASSSWSTASDIRDKKDIKYLTDALGFITSINPITYVDNSRHKYSEDNDITYDEEAHLRGDKKGTRRIAGVSAQEVYNLQKEYYGTDNYGTLVNWSKHDHPDQIEFDQFTVEYERFVPYLIAALKEEHKIVSDLSKRVEELENQIKKEVENI